MAKVIAKFDGHVFVPCEPVELPVGVLVEVQTPAVPRKPTPEEAREWQELLKHWRSLPTQGTLDDYLRYKRGEL